jgi:hypothetical protein
VFRWEKSSNNSAIEVIDPNGKVYTQADIQQSGQVELVEEFSDGH